MLLEFRNRYLIKIRFYRGPQTPTPYPPFLRNSGSIDLSPSLLSLLFNDEPCFEKLVFSQESQITKSASQITFFDFLKIVIFQVFLNNLDMMCEREK